MFLWLKWLVIFPKQMPMCLVSCSTCLCLNWIKFYLLLDQLISPALARETFQPFFSVQLYISFVILFWVHFLTKIHLVTLLLIGTGSLEQYTDLIWSKYFFPFCLRFSELTCRSLTQLRLYMVSLLNKFYLSFTQDTIHKIQ